MTKKLRKAFTIVELVIVIAVIAILAAVLIPTFVNVSKRAKESSDTQLIRNLNTALAADGEEHPTMQSAIEAAESFGFSLDKINAKAIDNEILWDSVNDCFVYLKDGEIVYIGEEKNEETEARQYWQIVDEIPDTQVYSLYAGGGFTATEVNVSVGFDMGYNQTVETVVYSRTAADGEAVREAVIRTASESVTLTVNAADDDVKHYGVCLDLTIEAVAATSYHEYGTVCGTATVKRGNFVTEKGSSVAVISYQPSAGATVTLRLEEGSSVGTVSAESSLVSEAQNAVSGSGAGNVSILDTNTIAAVVLSERNTIVAVTTDFASALTLEASEGGSVVLQQDVSWTTANSMGTDYANLTDGLTVDLNGHKLSATAALNIGYYIGNKSQPITFTMKNGTFEGDRNGYIRFEGGSTGCFENMVFRKIDTADADKIIQVYSQTEKVNTYRFSNCSFDRAYISFEGSSESVAHFDVALTDCSFEVPLKSGIGMINLDAHCWGTLELKNCTLTDTLETGGQSGQTGGIWIGSTASNIGKYTVTIIAENTRITGYTYMVESRSHTFLPIFTWRFFTQGSQFGDPVVFKDMGGNVFTVSGEEVNYDGSAKE